MKRKILVACIAASFSPAAFAQVADIRIDDGVSTTCVSNPGTPSSACTAPTSGVPGVHVEAIQPGTAASVINVTSDTAVMGTVDAVSGHDAAVYSLTNSIAVGSGVIANNGTTGDSAAVEAQTDASGTTRVLAETLYGDGTSKSRMVLEGDRGWLLTSDVANDSAAVVQTTQLDAFMGYEIGGNIVSSLTVNADGNELLGNTSIDGTLSATGLSTLNGVDNQFAGITNAGAVSGVTAGVVASGSTDAVNGGQLYDVQQVAVAAQTTADTALANAATAQTTADTALANAATAQTTADTALTNAASAQTTADTALTNAATAQTTADTALTNAATAQTTADTALTNAATAQSTADTALANAATAQTTADTALTNAATAQTTADGAMTEATAAKATVASVQATANDAMVQSTQAVTTANTVRSRADAAYAMAAGMDARLTEVEGTVRSLEYDINRVDRMAARGVAIATALASMPDIEDGKTAGFGLGVGSYAGRNAVSAAFILRASDSVKLRVNAGTAGDGKFAFGAGGMFSW